MQTFNEQCKMWSSLLLGISFLTLTLISFRQVPTFGETTIRRFDDVSEMKRLAGHDFEDLLQVSK